MAERGPALEPLAPSETPHAADDDPAGVDYRRHLLATGSYVISIALLVAVLITVWQGVTGGGSLADYEPGRDYATFHATAILISDGGGSAIYDPDVLGAQIAATTGYDSITTQPYGHPPFFPVYFLPLAAMPFGLAYLTFTLAGAIALAVAVRRVDGVRPGATLGLVALSFAGFWTLHLGQMGLWASAALLAVYVALRARRMFLAGLLLGVLIFKPVYVVGIGLWWLLYPRRYAKAIAGATVSSVAVGLLGFLVPGGWEEYRALVDDSGGTMVTLVTRTGYSMFEMFLSVFESRTLATVLWLLVSLVVVVALRRVIDAFDHKLELALAGAVIVGLVVSPRVGWYDWVLLVVPGVLLWRTYPTLRESMFVAGGWLFLTSAVSWTLANELDKSVGYFVQPAWIVLVGVAAWWVRSAARQDAAIG